MDEEFPPHWSGALGAGDPGALAALFEQSQAPPPRPQRTPAEAALVEAYRRHGYRRARLDPLERAPRPELAALDPAAYGLAPAAAHMLVAELEAAYCGPIGWDFGYLEDPQRCAWLSAQADGFPRRDLGAAQRLALLTDLTLTWTFEDFLRRRFPGAKLFGIEGAETFLLLIETVLAESAAAGVEEAVMGGMHRGRFTILARVLEKPLPALMAELRGGSPLPEGVAAASDVPYHLGWSGARVIAGRRVHLTLSPHPSHLQIVPVIALGRARGKQDRRGGARDTVLPLLMHTDASFAGQGIVAEMFQLSGLPPFTVGGAVHLVVDNQVGFTTDPSDARSARAPTDIARLVEAPVIHVNGDEPEAVHYAALTAARYRARFGADIVVRLVGYRRFGHNEIDEPRFTQPLAYRAIGARPPLHCGYGARLTDAGLDTAPVERAAADWRDALDTAYRAGETYRPNRVHAYEGVWSGHRSGGEADGVAFAETGVPLDRLRALGARITAAPVGFALEPKVARFLAQRSAAIEAGAGVDWATGEALAFASLLDEGTPLRFGGQDSLRGAFSQRHLALRDQETGARHLVLGPVAETSGVRADVFNTPLIEYAVVAFEYGVSLADPRPLVVWEAQFGEFLNIAQAVVDQVIVCGEDRWQRASGLVLLLPHGLDGGGPDHSTAHPERLLAACCDGNIQVVNASTPANFFHLLRRQVRRPFRKPLFVLTPKALLRHKACVSDLADFAAGTGFRGVLPDDAVTGAARVILCSGKIYYELAEARAAEGRDDVALARIEQLYPFPSEAVASALAAHPGADLVWCQEEPANMGAFDFVRPRIEAVGGRALRYAGRPAAQTPAVGLKARHEAEKAALLRDALR